jgi:hypothetical protein
MTENPDYYRQEGEVLDVVSNPQKGIIDIERDPTDNLVSEETYRQLPTRYVLRRFGKVLKEDTFSKKVKITRTQLGKTVTSDTVVQDIKVTKRVVLLLMMALIPNIPRVFLIFLRKKRCLLLFLLLE